MVTVRTKESQHGLTLGQRRLHIGCRVEPFRWEKVSRANGFYWTSLREELPGDETNPRTHHVQIKSWDCFRCGMILHVIVARGRYRIDVFGSNDYTCQLQPYEYSNVSKSLWMTLTTG